METKKKTDTFIIGTGVISTLFIGKGLWNLFSNKNDSLILLGIGTISLLLLFYILNKTKSTPNERYEDERKTYISEKSSSISFNILSYCIIIFLLLIEKINLNLTASLALSIIFIISLLIKVSTYFFCKYKY